MKMTSFLQAMDTIVNVRSYLPTPVSAELVEEVLYAFSLGPSLANTQPWELIMIRGEEQVDHVIASTLDPFLTPGSYGGQSWLKSAPFLFLVLLEKRRAMVRLGELGERFAIQDIYAAIQNARLVAASRGLSTSCVREFDPEKLQKRLSIPWYLEPIALVTVGYSGEEKEIPSRLSLQEFVKGGDLLR